MIISKNAVINEFHKPSIGKEISLKIEPLYDSPNSTVPFRYITGTYYFYDNKLYNGRARITKVKGVENLKTSNSNMIYGYINTI